MNKIKHMWMRKVSSIKGSTIPVPKLLFYIILYSLSFGLLIMGFDNLERRHRILKSQKLLLEKSLNINSHPMEYFEPSISNLYQKDIASEVLRLHVIANSDSSRDQMIKYAVRDEIIHEMQTALKNADTRRQAEEILASKQQSIIDSANEILEKYNCNDSIKIFIGNRFFPRKNYGDLSFPPGTYRALCVEIGNAQGRNWWCVLFPSLCFINEETATVPKKSKKKLEDNLGENEYKSLEVSPSPKPEIKSGLLEWLK